MKVRRLAALFLTLALALSLSAPAAAYNSGSLVPQQRTYTTPFTDTKGTWCGAAVQTCYEAGLMDGKTASTFDPAGTLTYAQIIVIIARLHSLLNGGSGQFAAPAAGAPWYQPAVDYLRRYPIGWLEETTYLAYFLEEDTLDYYAQTPCNRIEFVLFLAAVLPESALTPINTITALPDVSDGEILQFYNAGILTGSNEYGTFKGMEELTRGQAATILARVIDPAQRVKFTPKKLVASQAILGLPADTPMLTVDGYTVSAELYTAVLTNEISDMVWSEAYSYFDDYPEYYADYLDDFDFAGTFEEYLRERGIHVSAGVEWNTPDRGGMTPAQKVRENTLDSLKQMAVLLEHQSEFPLTADQQAGIQLYLQSPYFISMSGGFSTALIETIMTAENLLQNLTAKQNVSVSQLKQYLEEAGYIYGQSAYFYWDESNHYGYYDRTEAEAKELANELSRQIRSHMDEPDYLEYLLWKYGDNYNTYPDLIDLSEMSSANQTALKNLDYGKVAVLKEDMCYVIIVKLDPSKDEDVVKTAASFPAMVQVAEWADAAQVTTTAAYDAVDIAAAAAAYEALGI